MCSRYENMSLSGYSAMPGHRPPPGEFAFEEILTVGNVSDELLSQGGPFGLGDRDIPTRKIADRVGESLRDPTKGRWGADPRKTEI